jgi:hypothetical protein
MNSEPSRTKAQLTALAGVRSALISIAAQPSAAVKPAGSIKIRGEESTCPFTFISPVQCGSGGIRRKNIQPWAARFCWPEEMMAK